MKKLKLLQILLEGLCETASKERLVAQRTGMPSIERLLFGKQQAYGEILQEVNKMLETRKKSD